VNVDRLTPAAPAGTAAHLDRIALVDGDRRLTYGELATKAAVAARRLAARGIGPGDRVATLLPAGLEFAVLLHAVPLLGAALVPLSDRLTAAERRRRCEDAHPRVLLEAPLEDGMEAEVALRTGPDAEAIHTVLYTSGTTAQPKRVELTWANHRASALASAERLGMENDDAWLCCLPVHHVGGLAILLRSSLYGTTAVLHPRFDAERVVAALGTGEVTLISLVATMVRRLAEAGLDSAPRLRAALVGGGPVPRGVLEWGAERGLPLVQTYGMTETASQIATLRVQDALGGRGSAGRPLPGVELAVAEEGEILVRGPMVAPGALAADGWLHTGDSGRLDAEGFLRVEGRIANVIVTGGENVAAEEVEEVLLTHPAVAEAAVLGRPDPEWGEAVTAYVVLEAPASEEALRDFCRTHLAAFKVPKAVHARAALPRTAAGKLVRREIAP
jgi:O-succinylbenzoic acid--CoA ligase